MYRQSYSRILEESLGELPSIAADSFSMNEDTGSLKNVAISIISSSETVNRNDLY